MNHCFRDKAPVCRRHVRLSLLTRLLCGSFCLWRTWLAGLCMHQIGEYLLRMGYFEGAELLEAEAGFQGLLDLDVVRRVKQVGGGAIAWCQRSRERRGI